MSPVARHRRASLSASRRPSLGSVVAAAAARSRHPPSPRAVLPFRAIGHHWICVVLGRLPPAVAIVARAFIARLSAHASKPRPIYLVDYALYKPLVTCRVPFATFMEHSRLNMSETNSVDFQMRILKCSGLGEETCLPPANHYIPHRISMEASREEAELVMFSAVDTLRKKTKTKPMDFDVLIVNCSMFSPTPSLLVMIVNKYKMRSNIRSYNLSRMGSSADLISIDLARDLLQAHPNSLALVNPAESWMRRGAGVADEETSGEESRMRRPVARSRG
ncbi:hypothetical protein Scep_019868 [Stephania cephalantha]|uniref:FAE domain-containing protein n=1 Tax=Stephania cephalantha TaxID=152367 RepID=A0AAP0IBM3_9MAGN